MGSAFNLLLDKELDGRVHVEGLELEHKTSWLGIEICSYQTTINGGEELECLTINAEIGSI